jgi:hypothetical protein
MIKATPKKQKSTIKKRPKDETIDNQNTLTNQITIREREK